MLFDAVSELTHLVQAHRFGVHDIQIRHNFRIAADDESALEPEKEHHHAHCLAVRLLEKPTETVVISLTIKGFQVVTVEADKKLVDTIPPLFTKRVHYETLESLLMEISAQYSQRFTQALQQRLQELADK